MSLLHKMVRWVESAPLTPVTVYLEDADYRALKATLPTDSVGFDAGVRIQTALFLPERPLSKPA